MKDRTIRVIITFRESEITELKNEQDIDKLFAEKTTMALQNLKVDIAKYVKGLAKEATTGVPT